VKEGYIIVFVAVTPSYGAGTNIIRIFTSWRISWYTRSRDLSKARLWPAFLCKENNVAHVCHKKESEHFKSCVEDDASVRF